LPHQQWEKRHKHQRRKKKESGSKRGRDAGKKKERQTPKKYKKTKNPCEATKGAIFLTRGLQTNEKCIGKRGIKEGNPTRHGERAKKFHLRTPMKVSRANKIGAKKKRRNTSGGLELPETKRE